MTSFRFRRAALATQNTRLLVPASYPALGCPIGYGIVLISDGSLVYVYFRRKLSYALSAQPRLAYVKEMEGGGIS